MLFRSIAKVLVACLSVSADDTLPSWEFLVMTDWHGAEWYAHSPVTGEPGPEDDWFKTQRLFIRDIQEEFGGDLVILPGDTNSGSWHLSKYIDKFFPGKSPQEAVYQSGLNCYSTIKNLFAQGGYENILVAIGDHELGDNLWRRGDAKTLSLPQFRKSFVESFYMDLISEEYIFKDKPIGNADPTPYDTTFEYTSFAYRHKNALFVTIDAFTQISEYNYFDRENGLGGEGTVTGDVTDDHLEWFEEVLQEARNDTTIRHIIVQSHLPILQPVRQVRSSGMFIDRAENSNFWKVMEQYEVDVYFAGETHAFTASKTSGSNLIQIVSKSAYLQNFLKVTVKEELLTITAINDVRRDNKFMKYDKKSYEVVGSLIIDKSSGSTDIEASGILELLNTSNEPLVKLTFDALHAMDERQIYGFQEKYNLRPFESTMHDIVLRNAMHNQGTFGQQYDAHVGNLTITDNGINGSAARFDGMNSQMGVWAYGPQSGGSVISYIIWFKTQTGGEMILIHADSAWRSSADDNIFTLTLDNGVPTLYASEKSILRSMDMGNTTLNDGGWHQVVVSMAGRSCLLSQVSLFIDGKKIPTLAKHDTNLFFSKYSQIGVGSLGYSSTIQSNFPTWKNFRGYMDEVQVWGKTVTEQDLIKLSTEKSFDVTVGKTCVGKYEYMQSKVFFWDKWRKKKCEKKCLKDVTCFGYEATKNKLGGKCTIFKNQKPRVSKIERKNKKKICAVLK